MSEAERIEEQDGQPAKPQGLRARLKAGWAHAFAVEPYDESSLSEADKDVIDRFAQRIHEKRMSAPAIVLAESHRHMNFVGSQMIRFIEPIFDLTQPFVNAILRRFGMYIPPEDLPKLSTALEKRYSVEYFIQQLEAYASGDYNNRSAVPDSEEPTDGAGPVEPGEAE